jgi:uncharacterized protein YbjT (DUF2867 family)
MRIAVAGGTGTVGRHVVTAVTAAGHDPVVLSRSAGVDLMSTGGLAARLAGVRAVIDVSSTPSLSTRGAVRFFRAVTANLLAAERAAGVPHHVALSIIGAAAANSGHYAGKAVQEDLVGNSVGGWSLLRTTQFHEFARQSAERGSVAGLCLVPAMRCQPVAAVEVAAELVRVAAGAPVRRPCPSWSAATCARPGAGTRCSGSACPARWAGPCATAACCPRRAPASPG